MFPGLPITSGRYGNAPLLRGFCGGKANCRITTFGCQLYVVAFANGSISVITRCRCVRNSGFLAF